MKQEVIGETGVIGLEYISIDSTNCMFCRLKDFDRIATRYDKRADIFLSAYSSPQSLRGGPN